MPKGTFICFFIVLSLCCSCFRNSRLDGIESYIQERPDSALVALQNMSPSSLKGRAERARYALLYSIALDKNYIDISSDSTIIQAVKWYEKSGDKNRLMLSYYYAGRVQYNAANYAGAVTYAQKAIDLAVPLNDGYYQGLSCWLTGDVYYANHNYLKALGYYDLAEESFRKSGNDRYAIFSKCESAKMFLALGDYHKCDSVLNVVNSLLDNDDDALLSTYHSLKIRSLSHQGKDKEAIRSFECWKELQDKADPLAVYGETALSFAREGNKKNALECMEMAYLHASEEQMPLVSSYSGSILYFDGEYKQAIDSLQKGYDYQNKVAYVQFANSIDDALSEFYKSESAMKEQKMKGELVLVSIIAAILILAALTYYLLKKKEYTRKLNSAKADIAFISQLNRDSLQNFAKYMQIRQNVLDDVIAGYNTEKRSRKSGAVYDIVDDKIASLKGGGEGFKKLVKDLNTCFDGIVIKLKEHFPDLSKQDYHILVYYFGGFSQETVSTLTGIPVEKLYNLKRSWVERFNQIPSPDRELLLGRMNTSKYR